MKKIENIEEINKVVVVLDRIIIEEFAIEMASILTEMKFKDQTYTHPILSEAQFFNQTYTPQAQDYFLSTKEFVQNRLNKILNIK